MTLRDKSRTLRASYRSINGSTGVVTTSGSTKTLIRTTDGSENPKWREAIGRGEDATGSMTAFYDRLLMNAGSGSFTLYKNNQPNVDKSTMTHTWSGHPAAHECIAPASYGSGLVTTADARARNSFNKQAREFSSKMQGGVFLGELREARDMLRRPAASLREGLGKYLNAVLQRNGALGKKSKSPRGRPVSFGRNSRAYKDAADAIAKAESVKAIGKIAAETWLEYSFGWVPFIADIEDAFNAIDNLRSEVRYQMIAAGGQAESSGGVLNDGASILGMYHDRTNRLSYKAHVRYKGAIRIQSDMSMAAIAKNWGVHTSDFVPTAWELLPWSFLVDYFTNIGDILSYDNKLNSNLAWCAKGVKQTAKRELWWVPNPGRTRSLFPLSYISHTGSSSFGIYERSSITRTRGWPGDLTFLDLDISLPGVPTQWINMSALLASANSIHAQRFNRL